jgi:hypothetical protein
VGHRYVTPSTLSRVVALARRAFGDDADEPHYIQTVHGVGYRYVGPIERPSELSVDFAPPARMRLPARVEALIGRERELAQLTDMLTHHRAVTVLGTGGMGKTQCALEFARRVAPDYRDGVWFCDLAPLHSAGEWLRALAIALSIRRVGQSETLAEIARLLTGRRMLLVLDYCDRIAADTGELVLALLRSTDLQRVLSTSQQALVRWRAAAEDAPARAAGCRGYGSRLDRGRTRLRAAGAARARRAAGLCAHGCESGHGRGDLPAARRHAARVGAGGGALRRVVRNRCWRASRSACASSPAILRGASGGIATCALCSTGATTSSRRPNSVCSRGSASSSGAGPLTPRRPWRRSWVTMQRPLWSCSAVSSTSRW